MTSKPSDRPRPARGLVGIQIVLAVIYIGFDLFLAGVGSGLGGDPETLGIFWLGLFHVILAVAVHPGTRTAVLVTMSISGLSILGTIAFWIWAPYLMLIYIPAILGHMLYLVCAAERLTRGRTKSDK